MKATRKPAPAPARVRTFVAREPIVNRRLRVLGHQLRIGNGPSIPAGQPTDLTSALDPDELRLMGRGNPAFVPVNRESLLSPAAMALHPGHAVLELPPTIVADGDVRAACAGLRDRGFRFSIDDFQPSAPAAALAEFASYVKLDCSARAADDSRARLVATFAPGMTAVVATGVHTPEQIEWASLDGLEYFQGFMLQVPGVAVSGARVGHAHLPLLQLLKALNDPNTSTWQFEDLIKHDPALCYRILQTVNSAAFALRTTVYSMDQAILLLGRDVIRRWASLWTMAGLGADSHDEVVVAAAVRSRLCEALVAAARGPEAGGEAFLMGMCSTFDILFGRPLSEIAPELPIEPAWRDVLCGGPGPMRAVLDCVRAYERGEWEAAAAAGRRGGIDVNLLPAAFIEALRWAKELDELGAQIAGASRH